MARPPGSISKISRSCQHSHQLSVAQIAVTAEDMDADADVDVDVEVDEDVDVKVEAGKDADAMAERWMRSRTFFPSFASCLQANDAYLIGAKG